MSGRGRTIVLILFFWAVLAFVTPTLVRWSAAARSQIDFKAKYGLELAGIKKEEIYTLRILDVLPRRAVVPLLYARLDSEPASSPAAAVAS